MSATGIVFLYGKIVGMEKKYIEMKIWDLKAYKNNNKIHWKNVDRIAASIKRNEYIAPIIVDEDAVILAWHWRKLALEDLGIWEVKVLQVTGLSEKQKADFRIADNKTSELSEWDLDAVELEIDKFWLDDLKLDFVELSLWDDDGESDRAEYSKKIEAPVYEPSDEEVDIDELTDSTRRDQLLEEIKASKLSKAEKEMLTIAAYRHTVFDYGKIASYYASASKEMQELMEDSALVIIDFDKALELWYVHLSDEVSALYSEQTNEA